MIITEKVKIKIGSKNYNYYKNIIDNIKNKNEYFIDVENLHKGSHTKILVECDVCHKQSYKPYRQYLASINNRDFYCCSPTCAQVKNKKTNVDKYGYENVFQSKKIKNKIVKTNNDRYGVDYPSQSEEIREKIILSNIRNFGFDNPGKSEIFKEKMKKTRIKNGKEIPEEFRTEYEKYLIKVKNNTRRIRNKVIEEWDGFDYYDNEYIKENLKLQSSHSFYPTIDHKISVYYGFNNGLTPDEISKIENLCVTKRIINSSKNRKIEDVFIQSLEKTGYTN